MNGALFALQLVTLILAIPVCFLAGHYTLRAVRQSRKVSRAGFELMETSRAMVDNAERAAHLLHVAETRYSEAAGLDVSGALSPPLLELLPPPPQRVLSAVCRGCNYPLASAAHRIHCNWRGTGS